MELSNIHDRLSFERKSRWRGSERNSPQCSHLLTTKEGNRKLVPNATGRRRKRVYQENNEQINDAEKKLMIGWPRKWTHTHFQNNRKKRGGERRKITLECHQFPDRGRQDRRLQSPTVVCTGTNKETKEGEIALLWNSLSFKTRVPCYIRRQLSGKQMVFLGPLLLNHYTTKNNFRTSFRVINRLPRQTCNRFNWK